ncbi:LOW QUALITY PROTEIN: protein phosphatase 1 regulatory subunit 36 [Leptosomus discolor]
MIKLTPGVYWKDETNTLEFASSNPAAEENPKEENIHFQEMRVKTLKSIFRDDCSVTLPEKQLGDKEKLHKLSKWVQHEYVTLDDVKSENEKLDEFFMALLFYLSFYLEKIALEKKCRSLNLTMIFLEKKEMDDVLAKLAATRIHLAKVYCNLILGQGMAQQHPMPSGKRKASLQKDRSFFEGFYNFCSYVTWLVFRRKHFQVIREAIGRILCSDVFNPARDRNNVDLQKLRGRTAHANTVRLPCPRKVHAKHRSINSMVHQCSPVLSMLLPLPKDSTQYLSQNHYCRGRDPQPCMCDGLPGFSELFATKVGITGTHCSELKSFMPDGTMEEEEEEEEEEQERGILMFCFEHKAYHLRPEAPRALFYRAANTQVHCLMLVDAHHCQQNTLKWRNANITLLLGAGPAAAPREAPPESSRFPPNLTGKAPSPQRRLRGPPAAARAAVQRRPSPPQGGSEGPAGRSSPSGFGSPQAVGPRSGGRSGLLNRTPPPRQSHARSAGGQAWLAVAYLGVEKGTPEGQRGAGASRGEGSTGHPPHAAGGEEGAAAEVRGAAGEVSRERAGAAAAALLPLPVPASEACAEAEAALRRG